MDRDKEVVQGITITVDDGRDAVYRADATRSREVSGQVIQVTECRRGEACVERTVEGVVRCEDNNKVRRKRQEAQDVTTEAAVQDRRHTESSCEQHSIARWYDHTSDARRELCVVIAAEWEAGGMGGASHAQVS